MKKRLDIYLAESGIVQSRERARSLIMSAKVLVNGQPVTKAGSMVSDDAQVTIKEDIPYVSRGGLKLEAALDEFNIKVDSLIAMDVGASTGGFTDCLLQRGASRVYAIDVGYGQLDWNLRNDKRVIMLEKQNIRHLPADLVPEKIDIAVMDLSFISLKLVIAKVREFLSESGSIVALVKPQFEVGRGDVGKGGIVRDEKKRLMAVQSIRECFEESGMKIKGETLSPIKGQKGNIEYLLYAVEE
jgi:23S rRNA (cytidine1920-2'-O)/16S rRNA (cytidine1409-2'-O)-methyltransferase